MLGALLVDKTRRSVKFDRSENQLASTRISRIAATRLRWSRSAHLSGRPTDVIAPGLIVVLRSMSLQHFSYLSRQCRMVRADHRKMIPDHRNDPQSPGE